MIGVKEKPFFKTDKCKDKIIFDSKPFLPVCKTQKFAAQINHIRNTYISLQTSFFLFFHKMIFRQKNQNYFL